MSHYNTNYRDRITVLLNMRITLLSIIIVVSWKRIIFLVQNVVSLNVFSFVFLRNCWITLYQCRDRINVLLSLQLPYLAYMTVVSRKRLIVLVSMNVFSFSIKTYFLSFSYENVWNMSHYNLPMLRTNYCTFEHANTLLSIIWLSLVERDFIFPVQRTCFLYP